MSLTQEVFRAWGAPRAVMARRLERDGEERASFYLLAALFIQAISALPETIMLAGQSGSPEEEIGPATFATLTFRVIVGALMMYIVATLARLVARLFRGEGTWFGARLALFWALFSAAPLYLLTGAVFAVALVAGQPVLLQAASYLGLAGQIVLLWVWAGSTAAAEGFARPAAVAAVMAGFVLAILGAVALGSA